MRRNMTKSLELPPLKAYFCGLPNCIINTISGHNENDGCRKDFDRISN